MYGILSRLRILGRRFLRTFAVGGVMLSRFTLSIDSYLMDTGIRMVVFCLGLCACYVASCWASYCYSCGGCILTLAVAGRYNRPLDEDVAKLDGIRRANATYM